MELERSTLADWVGRSAALLKPLADAVGEQVMAASKLHADDTPVPVLEPGRGRTKTGRLWVYVRDDRPSDPDDPPAAFYRYSPDRKGASGRRRTWSCSPACCSRRLRDLPSSTAAAGSPRRPAGPTPGKRSTTSTPRPPRPFAEASLQRIVSLYEVEDRPRGRPPDERRRLRQAEASPRLAELHAWLDQQCARLPSSSKLAGALRCSLKRWPALTRYADAGWLEIDNTPPNARSDPWPSAARTTCSPAPTRAAGAPPSSTPSSRPPSSPA